MRRFQLSHRLIEVKFKWNKYMRLSCLIGIVFVFIFFPMLWSLSNGKAKLNFQRQASAKIQNLQAGLNNFDAYGRALQTSYHANYSIDSDTFRILVENIMAQMPSIQSVGFHPKVRAQESKVFIERQRASGVPEFNIFTYQQGKRLPLDMKSDSFPLIYEEPFSPDSAMKLGYDIKASMIFGKAVSETIFKNGIFVHNSNGEGQGDFFVIPIYEGRSIPEVENRRIKNVFGMVIMEVDLTSIIDEVTKNSDFIALVSLKKGIDTVPLSGTKINVESPIWRGNYFYSVKENITLMNKTFVIEIYEKRNFLENNILSFGISIVIGLIVTFGCYIILYEQYSIINQLQYIEAIEKEKMNSLSQVVAGIAHEINTPLGVGVTMISFMDKKHRELEGKFLDNKLSKKDLNEYIVECKESIDLMSYNLNRSAILVKNFKQLARQQSVYEKCAFNINSFVDEVVLSLKHEYKNRPIQLINDCPDNLSLYSFQGILIQVLTNLIMNSLVHGFKNEEQGTIRLTAEKHHNNIHIIYTDTGKGIPQENRSKIFEPFFTTNRIGGSSGLGLSIIYNYVTHDLGGSIVYEENIPCGVKFIIKIPIRA